MKTVEHLLEMGDSHQAKGAAVRSMDACMASGARSALKSAAGVRSRSTPCECAQRSGAQRGSPPKDARVVLDQVAQLSSTRARDDLQSSRGRDVDSSKSTKVSSKSEDRSQPHTATDPTKP